VEALHMYHALIFGAEVILGLVLLEMGCHIIKVLSPILVIGLPSIIMFFISNDLYFSIFTPQVSLEDFLIPSLIISTYVLMIRREYNLSYR